MIDSGEKIRIPVAIDNMENTVSEAQSATPERLYLTIGDRVVSRHLATRPFRIETVEALCRALIGLRILGSDSATA